MSGPGSPWVVRLGGAASPRLRVLCLPFSGAGASVFRPLVAGLPSWLELYAVQLAGREERRHEPPVGDLKVLVESIGRSLPPGNPPWVLLGHSLGGLLAFELARWLRRNRRPLPSGLVCSATRAPHLPYPHVPIHGAPDAVARERLRAFAGMPDSILDDPELLALFLPALRADLSVVETYQMVPEPPLPVPILGLWGEEDRVVTRDEVEAWSGHTTAGFSKGAIAGGHFFLRTHRDQVLDRVAAFLEPMAVPWTPSIRSAQRRASAALPGRP